jgi:chemotaxis methyl-accepting protein methylase
MRTSLRDPEQGLAAVVRVIEEATGIVIPNHRWPMVRAIIERQADTGSADQVVEQVVAGEGRVRNDLISSLLIAETFMFRHAGYFDQLREIAELRRHQGRSCRVLSVGCSTGEEVWSAAAVLTAVGPAPGAQIQVVGWDVTARRLAHAWTGCYSPWACRRGFFGYDSYFHQEGNRVVVDPRLREIVSFEQVNLVSGGRLPRSGPFDVVFFRNVSIYWRQKTTNQVCARLARLVADDGVMLVGPSDPVELRSPEWEQRISRGVRSFWRHSPEAADQPVNLLSPAPQTNETEPLSSQLRRLPYPTSKRYQRWSQLPDRAVQARANGYQSLPQVNGVHRQRLLPRGESSKERTVSVIARVKRLADLGEYQAALELLRQDEVGQTVTGKLWLGILMLSLDSDHEAVRAFRQCVYLQPEEAEYRRWLAVAYEAIGRNREAARELRNVARMG